MPLQDANPTPSFGGFGLSPPVGLSLEIVEDDDHTIQSASFSRCAVADLPSDLASGMTMPQRIKATLGTGARRIEDIREALDDAPPHLLTPCYLECPSAASLPSLSVACTDWLTRSKLTVLETVSNTSPLFEGGLSNYLKMADAWFPPPNPKGILLLGGTSPPDSSGPDPDVSGLWTPPKGF